MQNAMKPVPTDGAGRVQESVKLSKTAWQNGACRRKLLLSTMLRIERVDATRAKWRGRIMADLLAAWYRLLALQQTMPGAQVRAALVRLICWGGPGVTDEDIEVLQGWKIDAGGASIGADEILLHLAGLAELDIEEDEEDGERRILGVLRYALMDAEETAERCGEGEEFVAKAKERLEEIGEIFSYFLETHTDELERFEIVDVERWVDVPVETHRGNRSPNKELLARLDLLVRDRITGKLVIREFKTTGASRDLAKAADDYALDPQAAIQVMGVEEKMGERPLFTHVVIWAGIPGIPKRVKCRNAHSKMASPSDCTKCGGSMEAVSTEAITTTREIYEQAVRDLGLDPYADEDYARVLAGLGERDFHLEVPRAITQDVLDEVMAEAYEVATTHLALKNYLRRFEMRRGARLTALEVLRASSDAPTTSGLPPEIATRFYRNSGVCKMYGGCDYQEACLDCPGWRSKYVMKGDLFAKRRDNARARGKQIAGSVAAILAKRPHPFGERTPPERRLTAESIKGNDETRDADIPF